MIRIANKSNCYLLLARSIDEEFMHSPIHRIFIQSNLNGKLDIKNNCWIVPITKSKFEILQRITNHLIKYHVKYELDENSKTVLQEVQIAYNDYKRNLQKGNDAKRRLPSRELKALSSTFNSNFRRQLTKLQYHGLYHLINITHGANLSVPGSGKTSVILAYFNILQKQKDIDAMLVIGPGSCFEPWKTECESCFTKSPKIVTLAGKSKPKRKKSYLFANQYHILLTTYHSAVRDIEEIKKILQKRRYLVVLDESHYIKSPQGGVLAETILSLAPYAYRRVILTGTPMPNGLADLWTQFTFLWYDQFPLGKKEVYLQEIQSSQQEELIYNTKQKLNPLFFRTTKKQLELPSPTFKTIKCKMNPLQSRIYRGIAIRFLNQLQESPHNREALREWRRARIIRLIQVASNPTLLCSRCDEFQLPPLELKDIDLREAIEHYARYEQSAKVETACELVNNLCKEGNKVIIWSSFIHNLNMLKVHLKEFSPVTIHGGIPIATNNSSEFNRAELIDKFKNDSDVLVLIANPAACAESISLHRTCHHALYLDRSFNCAHYLQSLDRIHRLGLEPNQKTTYFILLAENSIDETINSRLKIKMKNMQKVIESSFPGELPGFWTEDLGNEEEYDFELVVEHLKSL